jgi:hypothetical protein
MRNMAGRSLPLSRTVTGIGSNRFHLMRLGRPEHDRDATMMMQRLGKFTAVVGLAAGTMLASATAFGAATPSTSGKLVTSLIGRWAGPGEAQYKDGKREPFKCVAVYFADKAGERVKQTIHCTSSGLELSLESAWAVKDGSISGTWHETKYELKGTLLGSLDPEGYSLYAENEFANATISVRTSACQQDVVMKFSKQVDMLTAKLKKC